MTSTHETRPKYPALGIKLHFGWGLSKPVPETYRLPVAAPGRKAVANPVGERLDLLQ